MVMRVVPLATVNTCGVCGSLSWKLWKRSMHILCEVIHVLLLGGHLPSLPHLITHNSATLFKAPAWMSKDNFPETVSSFYLYKFWDQLQLFRHCRKFLYLLSHHNNSDLGFLLSQLTLHVLHSEILISTNKKKSIKSKLNVSVNLSVKKNYNPRHWDFVIVKDISTLNGVRLIWGIKNVKVLEV